MWNPMLLLAFVTFVISGFMVNAAQVVLYVLLGWWHPQLFRQINYYFVWTVYAQVLVLADWWSKCSVVIHGAPEIFDDLGKEHCVVVMNHHYEIDWLFAWMVSDRFRNLGGAKVFLKKSLGYAPIIGWLWNFSDVIYLARNWEKDKEIIAKSISILDNYPHPIILLLFAEGTRYSPEKYQASRDFALKRGLPELKHHLTPRVKGFAETVKNLDTNKIKYLYDVTVVVNSRDGYSPTFSNVLMGNPVHAELYVKRILTKNIPQGGEDVYSKYLMDMYVEKDEIKDYYLQNGHFKEEKTHVKVNLPPRYGSLINSILWNLLVGFWILKLALQMLFSGSPTQIGFLLLGTLGVFIFFRKMVGLTKISKASQYGKKQS